MPCLGDCVLWKSCRSTKVMCDVACLSEGVFWFLPFRWISLEI
jgi:hypothetical protein